MRRIVAIVVASTTVGAVTGGALVAWRRNPRIGTAFVNSVVNPTLLRRGLAGGKVSEIGTLEHVGRTSGVRRLTPVHPEPTPEGYRIVVPLGTHSEWARNVQAAGHCRLQLHDVVYDLDEPRMILASDVDALPWAVRRLMGALGFQYLSLRTFAATPGTLEPVEADTVPPEQPEPAPEPEPAGVGTA
jgi:hypothetical protein